MNVSLSRARIGLIIVGDISKFFKAAESGKWKPLINLCIEEKRCFKVSEKFEQDNFLFKFMDNSSQYEVKPKDRGKKKKTEIKPEENIAKKMDAELN
jgi:hypothetical protein